MGDHERRDPALAGMDGQYDDPCTNPIAFLPVAEADAPREFAHDDGSTYTRVPSAGFESGDEIDSTTITDDGAPE